jgi:hypothetical protein
MLIEPKPGARLGLNDPLCKVKTTAMLTSHDSELVICDSDSRKPMYGTELYSQVKERDMQLPQSDDKPSRRKRIQE